MNNKKNNFDFIRFALAFVVVLAHIIDLSQEESFKFLRPFFDSYVSVTGFFIISGFLISKSYANTNTLKDYLSKRAKRLLPGYFFSIILFTLILSFLSNLGIKEYFLSPQLYNYYYANLIFLGFLHPCLPGVFDNNQICAVNGALWTIKVEIGFYLIIPVLIHLLNKTNKKHVLLSIIYIASIFYKVSMDHMAQSGGKLYDALSHQLPAFMSYFSCGIALHYYFDQFYAKRNILLFLAIPVYIIEKYLKVEFLTPIALSIIIFAIAYGFKFLNNFGKYGDFSYGIYIFHFPIIQIFVAKGYFRTFDPYLISATIIIIVLLGAIFSWKFVEKRFIFQTKQGLSKLTNPI